MNRRYFLLGSTALAFAAFASAPLLAARFRPTRFTVQTVGRGPDVILIPGLTSGRDVWRSVLTAVPGFRYHLIQVAGFAGEPRRGNGEGPVLAPLADELARYIEAERIDRPAIVGHSMGGTLAMMIGAAHPDRIGRIMVVDMLPRPAQLFGGTTSGLDNLLGNLAASPEGRRLIGSLMSAFTPPESNYRRSDPDVVARATHELSRVDLGDRLSRIRAPLTIVYASPDPRAARAVDQQFATAYAAVSRARLVRIDDSGHMIMLDKPGRFGRALAAFLAEAGGAASAPGPAGRDQDRVRRGG